MRRTTPLVLSLCLSLAFAVLACKKEAAPPPEPHARVECPELGLAFATLPYGFEVEVNQGKELVLTLDSEEKTGRMWVELGPQEAFGINLVEIVNSQKAIFEAYEEGEFFGNRELIAPQGPAYYSRGRFLGEGQRVEEVRAFILHPSENRLVTLHYRYPAGEDSKDRVNEMLLWLGEMEPHTSPAQAPADG